MLNKDLMLGGAKSASGGIGVAGEQGFGVGVYGGDEADLTAMGLSLMDGGDDPTNANYGNYVHTNGSVMVFVPAFCYRIGNAAAPSYSRDGANALEIGSPELDGTDGWILHRAFIDGGQQKLGFFMDKYLCSKSASNSNIAVSVKNANQISLTSSSSYINSSSMTGCSGVIYDAITLSRARGEQYACVSCFQWSAIAMLSLAHGQAVTSSENCAWYDSGYTMNFPKGNNNNSSSAPGDTNDSTVKYTAHSKVGAFGKTGSGTPFAKTTHNGQDCGICDINGLQFQPLLGIYQGSTSKHFYVAKESYKMHDFTTSNYNASSNFDLCNTGTPATNNTQYRFGNGSSCAFFTASSGSQRALCGVVPTATGSSSGGTALFGNDYGYWYNNTSYVVLASGGYGDGSDAGVWCRYGYYGYWSNGDYNVSFRAAGYAS